MISPLSLAFALQMAADGAGGHTAQVFGEELLHNGSGPLDVSIDQASKNLGDLAREISKPDANLILRIANGIWVAENAKLLDAYAVAQRANFDARVETGILPTPRPSMASISGLPARPRI